MTEMNEAIVDTNIISYFLKGNVNVIQKLNDYLSIYGYVNISVITFYEVLNGLYYKDAKKQLANFERFMELNQLIFLDKEISIKAAEIYAELRKTGQTLGHNDVLIAATALENDLTLVTNNTKDFSRIDGLQIDNWTIIES